MNHTVRSTIFHALAALGVGQCTLVPALAQAIDLTGTPGRARASHAATGAADHDAIRSATSGAHAPDFAVPALTSVAYGTSDDGTTWASGATYKASFGADGVTYIPFFGSNAPHNYPVKLTLGGAVAGGTPIHLLPVTSAVRQDDTITIDRGSVDEVYELALDHVEQRFVVKERPQAGALDLLVPLTSELELASVEGSIELRGEHGTVNYGRAFVLLEDGSRVPLETSVDGSAVRIHVDAAFMASARFPLVIDPIISNFAITAFGSAPAISYDLSTDRYLIAWEYEFSFNDHDVLWHMRGANGTPFANGVTDNSTDDCLHVRAANLEGHDQFLVVFQRRAVNSTFWKVWGSTIQATNGGQSGRFLISTEEMLGNKTDPDVGGDPYFGDAYYCVTWMRDLTGERDIHARLVRYNTTLVGSSTMMIDNTVGAIDSVPAISKSSGNIAAAAWTIAWERAGTKAEIYAARISYIGAMINPPTLIASSPWHETTPDVSSPRSDGRVCLVYGHDDYFHYSLLNGVTIEADGDISQFWPGEDPFYIYEYDFSVDTDGTHFVAGFSHSNSGGGSLRPFVLTLGNLTPTSLVVSGSPVQLGSQLGGDPDITSKWSSGGPSREFGAVWSSSGVDGATFSRLAGGPYATSCMGYGSGNHCPCNNTGLPGHGCANSVQANGGALLEPGGSAATGADDTLYFVLSKTPAGAPAILFQGTSISSSASAFGDGTLCTSGTIIRFAVKFPDGAGLMTWPGVGESPLSIQGGLPLSGGTRGYQCYYRDSASFCTASTVNTSNGVSAQWLP